MIEPAVSEDRFSWSLTAAVTIGTFLALLAPNVAPFELGAFVDQMHLDEKAAGLIVTTELFVMAVATLCTAPLLGRRSCRAVATVGLAVSLAGQVASVAAGGYAALLMFRSLSGCGQGMIYAAINAAGGRSSNPDRLFSYATAAALTLLGALLPVFAIANERFGFPGMYAVLAVCTLLALPATMGLPTSRPVEAVASANRPGSSAPVFRMLAVLLFFNVGAGAIWSLFERAGTRAGLTTTQLGSLAGVATWVSVLGALLVSIFAFRARHTIALTAAFGIAAAACYIMATVTSQKIFMVGTLLYWLGYMFLYPYLLFITSRLDASGRSTAIASGILMISYAAGPLAGTTVLAWAGYRALGWFGVACCLTALIILRPLALGLDRGDEERC